MISLFQSFRVSKFRILPLTGLCSLLLAVTSCKYTDTDNTTPADSLNAATQEENNATTCIATTTQQAHTLSKGTIQSVVDVAVYCPLSEQVVQLYVSEGSHINKGQTILALNDENLRNQLVQAQNEFEQANFQYEEILVGMGYKQEEFDKVPANVTKLAKVKSGYNIRQANLQQAQEQYDKRFIKAPVSGTVSDISVHKYDIPQNTAPLCRIFDAQHLKVVFNILESEREKIAIGNKVSVSTIAFSHQYHVATINLISSKVDENGMIKVEALIQDNENLIPGMTALVNL